MDALELVELLLQLRKTFRGEYDLFVVQLLDPYGAFILRPQTVEGAL
jgi:hypothetical protein